MPMSNIHNCRAIEAELLLSGTSLSPSIFSVAPAIQKGLHCPPTYIIHGSIDDKVVPKQSEDVYAALKAKNVTCKFDLLEGENHLFDFVKEEQMENMYKFLLEHL